MQESCGCLKSIFFVVFADNHSNGGVIFGAIVGVVLGTALIGLAGYFMCKKRKSEGFVHQRLYDDTRNDPGNKSLTIREAIYQWSPCSSQ